jgi:uncharacterized integral membrane protein
VPEDALAEGQRMTGRLQSIVGNFLLLIIISLFVVGIIYMNRH